MATPTPQPPSPKTAKAKPGPLVRQFSVFLENKCGRLLDLSRLFEQTNIHILALSVVDTSDSAVIRLIVDDPEKAAELFHTHQMAFSDTSVVVVELPHGPEGLTSMLKTLMQAEINIFYVYGFLMRLHDRPLLAFHVEDTELAIDVFKQNGFTILGQADISR
ncbi:MAG: acetolactate synthase [Verrucomicrobiae bacterium]|nr:acetolactate synthase [Verrucomicrobiae bacterium]